MLKMIAVVIMLIDHTAIVLIENRILGGPLDWRVGPAEDAVQLSWWWNVDGIMRLIGRLAFPIFCYLIVEGFIHTQDVKKYGLRLLVFGIISEIPFDLAIFKTWFYPQYQNVYFTLFLGLMALIFVRKYEAQGVLWKQLAATSFFCGIAWLLKTDYDAFGVFFIVFLYISRSTPRLQTYAGAMLLTWEITGPVAFVPIQMYNGKRGKWNMKYFFYAFYPVHFLVLTGLSMAMR